MLENEIVLEDDVYSGNRMVRATNNVWIGSFFVSWIGPMVFAAFFYPYALVHKVEVVIDVGYVESPVSWKTVIEIMRSNSFSEHVSDSLGNIRPSVDYFPEKFGGKGLLSLRGDKNTSLGWLLVRENSPQKARDTANVVAKYLIEDRRNEMRNNRQRRVLEGQSYLSQIVSGSEKALSTITRANEELIEIVLIDQLSKLVVPTVSLPIPNEEEYVPAGLPQLKNDPRHIKSILANPTIFKVIFSLGGLLVWCLFYFGFRLSKHSEK